MKPIIFFAGIDISKKTLDATIIDQNKNKLFYLKVSNDKKGIKKLLNNFKKSNIDLTQTLFCCENTGIYTANLANILQENDCKLWIENPIRISRSQALSRGKNDIIDSYRIANYALRFQDKAKLRTPSNKSLDKIKHLFSLRERLLRIINELKVPLNEMEIFVDKKFHNSLKKSSSSSIKSLKSDLKAVDAQLDDIINEDEALNRNYELAKSVPCIGKISAIYLLICTENYTKIKTYRKGACYAGIAPFEYSSGSSIRGRSRISSIGNKCIKKLLHICSLSVLKYKKGELYDYYKRKSEEGKHTMIILNALRNKLLNRVFACVNSRIKYNPNYINKLQQSS